MTDADRILQAIERLETGQKNLQATVDKQGNAIEGLQSDVKSLLSGQKAIQIQLDTLELKTEAFHSEQQQADREIIRTLHDIGETNTKNLENRVERIENHLHLPTVK